MPIRLLHLSDIHFGGENTLAVGAFLAFAAQTSFDLIVLSGDITQYGKTEEFAAAAAWLGLLPGPQLAVPGNHDTPWMGLPERLVAPFYRYARAIGPPSETNYVSPGLVVHGLNTARGWQIRLNWSKGAVSRPQVRRAVRRLSAAPTEAIRVVVCHHPLVEFIGEPMTARVRGGRFAASLLSEANIDLVLTGHLHAPFVQPLPFGDLQTYAVGAGTLSLRERGEPPSFNILDIDADQVRVTAMAWDGRAFDPARHWSFQLRHRHPIAGTMTAEAGIDKS